MGKVLTMEVAEAPGRRRGTSQWKNVVEYVMRVIGLEKGMAMDRVTWRRQSYRLVNPC